MKTLERAVVAVSIALLVTTIFTVSKARAAYPAVCEISIKNMITEEVKIIQGKKTVPTGIDRFEVFDACQALADMELIKRPDSKVVQVKAYFL